MPQHPFESEPDLSTNISLLCVGLIVGGRDGEMLGIMVGSTVGSMVGSIVGSCVGSRVGSIVGGDDGLIVGSKVGANVGSVGACVGGVVGFVVCALINDGTQIIENSQIQHDIFWNIPVKMSNRDAMNDTMIACINIRLHAMT